AYEAVPADVTLVGRQPSSTAARRLVRVRVAPGRSRVTTAETRGDIRGVSWVHCLPAPRSDRCHVARPTLACSTSAEHRALTSGRIEQPPFAYGSLVRRDRCVDL